MDHAKEPALCEAIAQPAIAVQARTPTHVGRHQQGHRERSMKPSSSLIDRFFAAVRNNRFTATLIVVGIMVTSLASFTDALTKLAAMLPELRRTNVAGSWQSEVLTDVNTRLKYTYVFTLKADGALVYGSAARMAPACQGSNAGVCSGFGRTIAVNEGKVEHNGVSFVCDWGELPGAAPWTYVKVKQAFRGAVNGKSIRFLVEDDQNSPPIEFGASPVSQGAVATTLP